MIENRPGVRNDMEASKSEDQFSLETVVGREAGVSRALMISVCATQRRGVTEKLLKTIKMKYPRGVDFY